MCATNLLVFTVAGRSTRLPTDDLREFKETKPLNDARSRNIHGIYCVMKFLFYEKS